ncbi:MAG: ParB N-terminal domain-containing protein [Eubacteriales bacterium]|nr:ParB N-terminal domain-containing protein [Eubacteriales bacterium]
MAKVNFNQLKSSFNGSAGETKSVSSEAQGTMQLIDFNLIKKNPLNTGNDKSPEVIEALKASIQVIGVLEPPIVYKDDDGFYMLISGEGRYTAIKELRKEKDCYNQIVVMVRPKPRNKDEEMIWIISANEQRNAISLDRTRKNIRQLIQNAKNLADQGMGEFDELIKGMTMLKQTSTYNYLRINEDLIPELIELFDEDKLTVRDASYLCRFNKTEQKIILEHFYKDGKITINRKEITSVLEQTKSAAKEDFGKVDEMHAQIKEKEKEIRSLTSKLTKLQKANTDLEQKVIEALRKDGEEGDDEFAKTSKELKRIQKQNRQKENELKKSKEEAELLKEKLKLAEQMLPSFSDEEILLIKSKNEISVIISAMCASSDTLSKKIKKFKKNKDSIPEDLKAELLAMISQIEKVKDIL